MDEKNNTINNNDSQNSMNYSFDFANQVDNTVPAQNNVEPETLNVTPTPVQVNEPVNTPQVSAINTVNNTASTQGADVAPVASEVTNTAMPGVTPVVPVTPEMVTAQNKEEENVELIKDKKATKNFLIVLFVLLIAFVIALPIIFNFIG